MDPYEILESVNTCIKSAVSNLTGLGSGIADIKCECWFTIVCLLAKHLPPCECWSTIVCMLACVQNSCHSVSVAPPLLVCVQNSYHSVSVAPPLFACLCAK